jgi:hypothetical protein
MPGEDLAIGFKIPTIKAGWRGVPVLHRLILKFFAGPIVAAAGPLAFDHAFGAWLIMWGLFTAVFAIGASSISLAAFAPFTLAFVVLVVLAIADFGGTASWTADVSKIGGWVAHRRWFRGRIPGRRHRAQRDPRQGTAADVAGQVAPEDRIGRQRLAPRTGDTSGRTATVKLPPAGAQCSRVDASSIKRDDVIGEAGLEENPRVWALFH